LQKRKTTAPGDKPMKKVKPPVKGKEEPKKNSTAFKAENDTLQKEIDTMEATIRDVDAKIKTMKQAVGAKQSFSKKILDEQAKMIENAAGDDINRDQTVNRMHLKSWNF
jgi:predicted RNase H-like nuclease (RuvC/YqgF family)